MEDSTITVDKTVAIFGTATSWSDVFALEIELIEKNLNAGLCVKYVCCEGVLQHCKTKQYDIENCGMCVYRRRQVISEFQSRSNFHYLPMCSQASEIYPTVDETRIRNAYVGYFRSDEFSDVTSLKAMSLAASTARLAVFDLLKVVDGQLVAYVFNGRFPEDYGFLLGLRETNIEWYTFEFTSIDKKYLLIQNSVIHDLSVQCCLLDREIKEVQEAELITNGVKFFNRKRLGIATNDVAYITRSHSQVLRLPGDGRINLAIFSSSEDEMIAGGFKHQYINDDWLPQVDFIQEVISTIDCSKYNIILRMHPNQANDKTRDTRRMRSLASDIHVILPEEPVNSYDIVDWCDVVLCFGSTIGLEAAYAEKPVLLVGHTYWESCKGVIRVRTVNELVQRLQLNDFNLACPGLSPTVLAGHLFTLGTKFECVDYLDGKFVLHGNPVSDVAISRLQGRVFTALSKLRLPFRLSRNIIVAIGMLRSSIKKARSLKA